MTRTRTTWPDGQRPSGAGVLGRGAVLTVLLGVAGALVGLVVSGPAAARGVVVGTVAVVVVCATGTLLVHAVAGLLPAASLLVSLLTYTLQVLALLLVFVGLERSGLVGSTLAREWVGGAAITATLVWLGTQLLLTVRQRIPAYDLPIAEAVVTPVTGRPGATEAGER